MKNLKIGETGDILKDAVKNQTVSFDICVISFMHWLSKKHQRSLQRLEADKIAKKILCSKMILMI